MSYFVLEVDEDFARTLDDLVMTAPDTLRRIVERAEDWNGPIRHLAGFGPDAYDGEFKACVCNTARYEAGHMQTCPLSGYPPEVVVIDKRRPGETPGEG